MASERDLPRWREDPVPVVCGRVPRRQDERRLGKVHFPRDPEHLRVAPARGGPGLSEARKRRASLSIRDRRVSRRVQKFPESVIREMTRIASLHGAVNLAQGFPDFDPPRELVAAAKRALDGGYNQYSITWGAQELREAVAAKAKAFNGIDADPEANLVVTCGSTEAVMAAMLSLVNPGEEVVVFEPFYENYGPDAA